MGYVTTADMKGYLGERVGDLSDALVASFVDQASTAVDLATGRFFTKKENEEVLFNTVDARRRRLTMRLDLLGIDSLHIDDDESGTWSTEITDDNYQLYPLDASLKGQPYDEIRLVRGDELFPRPSTYPSVRIIGDWGWDTVPAPIVGAVQIIASRLVARINAPLGASGSPDSPLGVSQVMGDPELALLLEDYVLPV